MSVFKNTPLGDLERGPRGFSRTSGIQETLQHLRTRYRLISGEVARDTRIGLRLFDFLMDPSISTIVKANYLATYGLETPGASDIELKFRLDNDSGELELDMDITFEQSDLDERRPIHETLQINTGGFA